MTAHLFLRCSECHQIRLCDDPGDTADAICDPCWDERNPIEEASESAVRILLAAGAQSDDTEGQS